MNPKYAPMTPDARIARVIEECGEVLKDYGKMCRFGASNRPPDGGPTNAEALLSELVDLKGAIESAIPDVEALIKASSSHDVRH